MPDVHVRDLDPTDRDWAAGLLTARLGGLEPARLGEPVDPMALEGLVAEAGGRPIGFATVRETTERGMEVVTLVADPPGQGAGTALLDTAWHVAAASGHHRLWLVATNANLPALHFFLRRGMRIAAVHDGALELELPTGDDAELVPQPFPRIADLDRLPAEAFVAEVTPLFEGAPRFLARLAGERPFGSDERLVEAAFDVARSLPEEERIELVEAHPRIGAAATTVSAASYDEQGYAAEADDDPETARVYEELAILNDAYEARFGFRYVVFVAGRPKAEIIPLLEHALRNDRDAELRRSIDDTIYIAGDRLRTLRGLGTEV